MENYLEKKKLIYSQLTENEIIFIKNNPFTENIIDDILDGKSTYSCIIDICEKIKYLEDKQIVDKVSVNKQNIERQYLDLLKEILENGVKKEDRTGTGTISIFGKMLEHDMSEGFPLLTTKEVDFKGIVTELLWFLRGETNIKYLVDNGCNIWNGDAWKNYINKNSEKFKNSFPLNLLENSKAKKSFIEQIKTDEDFAKKWGDLGPIYGKQWREYSNFYYDCLGGTFSCGWKEDKSIDQIGNLINDLKTNPDSRRLIVNAWNVSEISDMVLPPCHYGFQVYTRELTFEEKWCLLEPMYDKDAGLDGAMAEDIKDSYELDEEMKYYNMPTRAISLMFQMRSNDFFLGSPYNIASYALLLELLSKEVNMIPDKLKCCLGDVHLYSNHIEQAKLQLTREPNKLPKLLINFNNSTNVEGEYIQKSLMDMEDFTKDDFELVGYNPHPSIKAPLSN